MYAWMSVVKVKWLLMLKMCIKILNIRMGNKKETGELEVKWRISGVKGVTGKAV